MADQQSSTKYALPDNDSEDSQARLRPLSTQPVFYAYITFIDGIPANVGKGSGRRWRELEKDRNPYLLKALRKAWRLGKETPTLIVRGGLIEAEAFRIEAALILAIGRRDLGTGPLYNLTDGGGGVSGYRHTPDSKARISANGKWLSATPEQRAAMIAEQSAQKKGVRLSETACENISAGQLASYESDPARAERLSASITEFWGRPGQREVMKLGLRGGWEKRRQKFGPSGSPPTLSTSMSAAQLARYEAERQAGIIRKRSDESRARMRAARLAFLAKEKASKK